MNHSTQRSLSPRRGESAIRYLRAVVAAALTLLPAVAATAAEIVVAQDGSGDYLTIQAAADVSQHGDIVSIKAGTYHESLAPPVSGTAVAPIVYRSFGDGEVIIAGDGVRDTCVLVSGRSFLHFEELILDGAVLAGFYTESPAAGLRLERLEVRNIVNAERAVGYGIYFYARHEAIEDVSICSSTVHHTSSHGIFLYGKNYDFVIDTNEVSYSGIEEGDWGHSIKTVIWDVHGPENGPVGITITNNELHHAWTQGIMTWNAREVLIRGNHIHHSGATGIQIEDGTVDFVVEGNTSEWNQQGYSTETGIWIDDARRGVVRDNIIGHNQVGIKVSKSAQIIVRNNTIFDSNRDNPEHLHNGGIFLLAYDGISNSDTIVVHNTLHGIGNPDYLTYRNAAVGLYEYDALVTGFVLRNNIVSMTVSGPELELPTGTLSADHNDYFNPADFSCNWHGDTVGWQGYRAASGQDGRSLLDDPSFRDPDAGSFALGSGSPCIDAGGFLTTTSSSGSGNVVSVADARYFSDGFGVVAGDEVIIGDHDPVTLVGVDYAADQLTLSDSLSSWSAGDPISYAYHGAAPDIGAVERYCTGRRRRVRARRMVGQPAESRVGRGLGIQEEDTVLFP